MRGIWSAERCSGGGETRFEVDRRKLDVAIDVEG